MIEILEPIFMIIGIGIILGGAIFFLISLWYFTLERLLGAYRINTFIFKNREEFRKHCGQFDKKGNEIKESKK